MSTFNIGTSGNQNIPTWSIQLDGVRSLSTRLQAGTQLAFDVPMEISPTDVVINSTKDVFVSETSITPPIINAQAPGLLLNPVAVKIVKNNGERLNQIWVYAFDECFVTLAFFNNDPMDFNY